MSKLIGHGIFKISNKCIKLLIFICYTFYFAPMHHNNVLLNKKFMLIICRTEKETPQNR